KSGRGPMGVSSGIPGDPTSGAATLVSLAGPATGPVGSLSSPTRGEGSMYTSEDASASTGTARWASFTSASPPPSGKSTALGLSLSRIHHDPVANVNAPQTPTATGKLLRAG